MKKLGIIILLFAGTYKVCLAQTIAITGIVKSEQGMPVHYAFVQDKQTKAATYTDSLGTFRLTVNPTSQIMVNSNGYIDATVDVGSRKSVDVVLKADPAAANGSATASKELAVLQEAFKSHNTTMQGTQFGLGGIPVYSNVRETVGSRFLFNQWVHGFIVKTTGEVVQGPAVLLNYDKMDGDLYLTENNNSVLVGDKNTIKSFTLFGPHDQPVTFEMMTGISTDHYTQVISAGPKYKIYKQVKTKFIPSNFKTDGLASSGNKYDEYADEYSYFIQNVTTTAFQPLNLKKKAFKEAFAAEGDKLTNFLAAHNGKIDDAYLKALADAMNGD